MGVTMDMTALFEWLEAASSLAVLITLIYLARQVRQENLLLRSEARQALVSTDQDHINRFIDHPDLAKTFAGKEPVTEDELTRMNFWIISSLRAREHEWAQYNAGALDKETWFAYSQVIYFTLGTERARQFWAACKVFFDPAFVEYVEDMIKEAPPVDYWDKVKHIT
jgi:hypothetical protein